MFKHLLLITTFITIIACNCKSANNGLATHLNATDAQCNEQQQGIVATAADTIQFNAIVQSIERTASIGETAIGIGKSLLGLPYIAATLEQEGDEKLVVNIRELDCTTFVENVVAFTLCIHNNRKTFTDYCNQLKAIRYRNGKINHYPSRLHYFTEWLTDNQQKGIIDIVSEKFGNAAFTPKVNFMSTHPDKYKQLSNQAYIDKIAEAEKRISNTQLRYITKDHIEEVADQIKDGDIIAIATTLNGLDISHVGIAIHVNNKLHLMHASSTEKKVVISAKPLSEYMAGIKSNTGILVARMKK